VEQFARFYEAAQEVHFARMLQGKDKNSFPFHLLQRGAQLNWPEHQHNEA